MDNPRLPNFLVVGAAKAGTTSLYHYLREHPQVFLPSAIKETFFFSGITSSDFPGPGSRYASSAISNPNDYFALFAKVSNQKAIGEVCVAYLHFHKVVIPRIIETLGQNVKIIIILRDPVDRAFSNYMHHVRDGIEPLPFDDAIDAIQRRLAEGWWWGFDYVGPGRYYRQVKNYLTSFGASQVLTLLYDDYICKPQDFLRTVLRFLKVDDTAVPDMSVKYNTAPLVPRNRIIHTFLTEPNVAKTILKPLLPGELRQRLASSILGMNMAKSQIRLDVRRRLIGMFEDDILDLQDLICRDLNRWLQ